MRLLNAHITNYRSIENAGRFDVDPAVTCLVGKNEAGKTAVLQALYRLNPVERKAVFDETLDFPAKRSRQRRQSPEGRLLPVVVAEFELTDGELEKVEDELGRGALRSKTFTLTRGYRTGGTCDIPIDEAAIIAHLVDQLDPTTKEAVGSAASVEALVEAMSAQVELPNAATALLEWVKANGGTGSQLALAQVLPMMPRFVYFEDYDSMPGKVAIPDLLKRRSSDDLSRGEQALVNLLSMAGTDVEDFERTNNNEALVRDIENAGTTITEEVFEYWTQNTGLSVKLDTRQPEDKATGALAQGTNLQVRVHNARHSASVPFDERSRGFVWFFSFLAYFTELEDADDDTDLILLLDEPGLSLHGRAQADLLRLIEDRLAPKHQVIYTTHSPFMVSPDHLERVRTVIDHDPGGTQVSAEVFKADEDTAAPLMAAMGIELSQTLFVGPHQLLLEGPSDLIYLDVLNGHLGAAGRTTLDPRWTKVPVGGAGKLSTFVTLLGANKLDVAVLIDSSTQDRKALKHLESNNQMRPGGLLQIGEIVGRPEADVEDLFDIGFYLKLVNIAYDEQIHAHLQRELLPSDLNERNPRIAKRVEQYFTENDIANGEFSHYRPAAVLIQPGKIDDVPGEDTLAKAEVLFTRLNALLAS